MSSKLVKALEPYVVTVQVPRTAVQVSMTILIMQNGVVEVQGPIKNRELCDQMLEAGKKALDAYQARVAQQEAAALADEGGATA